MSLTATPDADERRRALNRLADVHRRGRARKKSRAALAIAAVLVVVAAGLSAFGWLGNSGDQVVRVASPSLPFVPVPDLPADAVPWADNQPSVTSVPSPTTTLQPTSSPPCRASQLTVAAAGQNGAGGVLLHYYTLTNVSSATCRLAGYPKVVASEVGQPDVVATDGGIVGGGGVPGDLATNGSSQLVLETESTCAANPTGASGVRYHRFVVTLAGGGDLVLPGTSMDLVCGLWVDALAGQSPVQAPPPDPVAALTAKLLAPAFVRAGTIVVYAVQLTNPTDAQIRLEPCPNFLQVLADGIVKDGHQLNCAQATPIPPHTTESFIMHLVVPTGARSGQASLTWELGVPNGSMASVVVEIQEKN